MGWLQDRWRWLLAAPLLAFAVVGVLATAGADIGDGWTLLLALTGGIVGVFLVMRKL